MDTINSRISSLISALGITKTAFAERIHVSQAFISAVCCGQKNPSDRTLLDICREFKVSEAWLRTGEGEMFLTRTPGEELTALLLDVMADSDEAFRKRVVTALLSLPPEWWGTLEQELKKRFRP